jgi:predicted enzyme related to lactoylglutathione lyase
MQVTEYVPGTPSWADVSSPDVERCAAFYGALFGWTAIDQGEEAGHYTMFEIDGKPVAACGPLMPGDPGPPSWTTYITVADVAATATAITENGGTVIVPPMDVMDAGRMAIATDPSGGFFSVWEPRAHIGAQLVNEANTMCWNELTVRNADNVLPFYSAVFGWTVVLQGGEGAPFTYRELQVNGRSIGGCMEMDEKWPPEIPTHWMVYFAVDDVDATAARAAELGGMVSVEPTDIMPGRFAVLNDPAGAVFSVIKMNEPI